MVPIPIVHSRINEYKEKLKRAGIASIGDIVIRKKRDLLKIHGIGSVFVKKIEYEIFAMIRGLHFGMEIYEWPPSPERANQLTKQLQINTRL